MRVSNQYSHSETVDKTFTLETQIQSNGENTLKVDVRVHLAGVDPDHLAGGFRIFLMKEAFAAI